MEPVWSPAAVSCQFSHPWPSLIDRKLFSSAQKHPIDFLTETEKWSESQQQAESTVKKGTNTQKKASKGLQQARKKAVCNTVFFFLTISLFPSCVHVCLPLSICTLINVALSFIPLRALPDVMWPDGQKFRGKQCQRNKSTSLSAGRAG